MSNSESNSLREILMGVRAVLQQPPSGDHPSGHDLLNSLHTVLCSIEMLALDVPKQQREVFERLDTGAQQLQVQLLAYIKSQSEVKNTIVANINAVVPQ